MKRLLVDFFSLREACRTGVLSSICCIKTGVNLADSVTKVSMPPYISQVMHSKVLDRD